MQYLVGDIAVSGWCQERQAVIIARQNKELEALEQRRRIEVVPSGVKEQQSGTASLGLCPTLTLIELLQVARLNENIDRSETLHKSLAREYTLLQVTVHCSLIISTLLHVTAKSKVRGGCH